MDPLILAAHVQIKDAKKIIDIGCGCAIIPLILSLRHSELNILGIEIQEELSRFARQNIADNKLENTIQIMTADIKDIKPGDINGKVDIIVSNPPYKKKDTGRLNPNFQKAVARHEITLDINSLFNCSSRLLTKQGKLYIIFPAERLSELFLAMDHHKFNLATIRFVHIKKDTPASRVIICARKDSRENCIVDPPFTIYSTDNNFTDEYNRLMAIIPDNESYGR